MKPIDFPQSTKVLQKPPTMTDEECSPLHVWSDGEQCVSCWKPSFIERLKILFTGKVWLGVLSGETQPPVFLSGERVFVKKPKSTRICAFFSKAEESIVKAWKSVCGGFKQPDKRKHFIAGLVISILVGVFNPWIGLGVGVLAGAFKELWDKKGNGTPEWMDFVFTCLGALCGFIIIYPLAYCLAWLLYNLIH